MPHPCMPILHLQRSNEYIYQHIPEYPKLKMCFPHLPLYVPDLPSTRFSRAETKVYFLHLIYPK